MKPAGFKLNRRKKTKNIRRYMNTNFQLFPESKQAPQTQTHTAKRTYSTIFKKHSAWAFAQKMRGNAVEQVEGRRPRVLQGDLKSCGRDLVEISSVKDAKKNRRRKKEKPFLSTKTVFCVFFLFLVEDFWKKNRLLGSFYLRGLRLT